MTSKRSDLDAILSSLVDAESDENAERLMKHTLKMQRQVAIQNDMLQQERQYRDRVATRRQKSILFSKSQDLALLERLCRKVAGILCDTSWNKLFVADPDVVLASKILKPHRQDAKARAKDVKRAREAKEDFEYETFAQPDALVNVKRARKKNDGPVAVAAPVLARRNPARGSGRGRGASRPAVPAPRRASSRPVSRAGSRRPSVAAADDDEKMPQHASAGMFASLTAPGQERNARDPAWKKLRVGQKLSKDERWPAWLAPGPELQTRGVPSVVTNDQLYMDQFGAYLSETMLAAMEDVVAEIRVQDTLSQQVRRIPIRRLIAEPLVSNWFAKWIATVILKNRAFAGKTWHKDVIIDNLGKQLDECRGFFQNPTRFGAAPQIYNDVPPVNPNEEDDVDEEEEDDDDEEEDDDDEEEDDDDE